MNQKFSDLSMEEKKMAFRKTAITHRLLEQTDRTIMGALPSQQVLRLYLCMAQRALGRRG